MPAVPLPPPDPDLPALHTLLGPDAEGLMSAVVAAGDGRLRSLETTQVRYVPGKSVTVQYRAGVLGHDDQSEVHTYVASSGIEVPEGTAVFEADGMRLSVWRFPDDPFLPGLRTAVDARRVVGLLGQVGVRSGTPRIRTRAYRGGRRAVVEVAMGSNRVFVKVLRPSKAGDLQRKHVRLAEHLPVPHSHGWSEAQGLVVLQAMPGRTLRKALESGSRRLPSAAQLLALLGRFPDPPSAESAVPGAHDRAAVHSATLAVLLPEAADRLASIVSRVEGVRPEHHVGVHGDYHASQVLVRSDEVIALVDVDTAGVGERANDLANILGHLSTLGRASGGRRNIERYGRRLIAAFDEVTDPHDLRLRTAAVVLGLATGPFRVQSPTWPQQTMQRIALAEEWMAAAES